MSPLAHQYPKPPAQAEVYVSVLGPDLAIEFFLTFGGAELPMSGKPRTGSRLVTLVGLEKARAMADQSHLMQTRVPLVKRWIAGCLRARGQSVAEIARTLRVTDVSVRKYLAPVQRDDGDRERFQ